MLVQGVAPVEGVRHVAVPEAVGVAAAAPGVIAQALHGVAVDGGRQAALVVFQGVVHRASLVGLISELYLSLSHQSLTLFIFRPLVITNPKELVYHAITNPRMKTERLSN